MPNPLEGFIFNDFCLRCHKITEHRIEADRTFFGVCASCSERRKMTDLQQVYYPKTDLWVTRFKIGNLPGVVAGKLLDVARKSKPNGR